MTIAGTSRWTLTVEFDPLDVQADKSPDLCFPYDEASRFVHYVAGQLDLLPEEIPELIEFTSTTVIVIAEVLDYLAGPMNWLTANVIPKSITLTRDEERN